MYSLSGATYKMNSKISNLLKTEIEFDRYTIISCFLVRILKNVRSLVGSNSRTTLHALSASWLIKPAYWIVVALSKVDLIGMPSMYSNYLGGVNVVYITNIIDFETYYLHYL